MKIMSTGKTKLAPLKFTKLSEKETTTELKKYLEDFVSITLSTKYAHSINFMNRKLIFALNKQFIPLFTQLTTKKGVFGLILEYNVEGDTYYADKTVISNPQPHNEILFEITNLAGAALYSGTGKISGDNINFTIKGKPIEGSIRSTISGTITRSGIIFKKSTMPNKIYKKMFKPKRFNTQLTK